VCGGGVGRGGGGVRRRATKLAAGDEGDGGVRQRCMPGLCHLNFQGARTMRANRYIGGGPSEKKAPSQFYFVFGHKFYVCDLRKKHKLCILAYHNLCFCVFVF
jgi:hypothetical protein